MACGVPMWQSVSDKPALRALSKLQDQLRSAPASEAGAKADASDDGEAESKAGSSASDEGAIGIDAAVAAARDAVLVRFDALQAQGAGCVTVHLAPCVARLTWYNVSVLQRRRCKEGGQAEQEGRQEGT